MIYEWRGASSNRIDDLFKFYGEEIISMKLIESMRFRDKKDIENLINEVRNTTYDINQFESSENIKYIKMEVEDKNFFNRKSKNIMYSKLQYKIFNDLPKYEDRKNKSIGILCRNNEQVKFLRKALREKFKIHTKIINNNEEEHNIMCDLIEFLEKPVEKVDIDEISKEVTRYIFWVIYDNNIGSIKRINLETVSFSNYKNAKLPILKKIKTIIEEVYLVK